MSSVSQRIKELESGLYNSLFETLYGTDIKEIDLQHQRYKALLRKHQDHFGNREAFLFSSPGRIEIGGNHTDHNQGKVLAASITLDCIGIASHNDLGLLRIVDETTGDVLELDLQKTDKVEGEKGTIALLRGILDGFKKKGYRIGGFDLTETSNVISAAGVSSSASFEMLLGTIVNVFFNRGEISIASLAKIGQYAENYYWGKQSGLLDQMSCGVGGLIRIDFEDPTHPKVDNILSTLQPLSILLINTGGSHAHLNEEYSSIPKEMMGIAELFGEKVLRAINLESFKDKLPEIRTKVSDRAILRALHYFEENHRVDQMVNCLLENQISEFLALVNDSGNSSWKWLQNCYVANTPNEQGISLALALTELYIKQKQAGACRVHGGGFAGVIAVYLEEESISEYTTYIKRMFGQECVFFTQIRPLGSICLHQYI